MSLRSGLPSPAKRVVHTTCLQAFEALADGGYHEQQQVLPGCELVVASCRSHGGLEAGDKDGMRTQKFLTQQ